MESRAAIAMTAAITVFLDPKVAAVVLALVGGKLVMVKRGMEPQIGRWAFPSGFVDRGEAVEDAAVREFKEETGLDARLERLIGVYSATGSPVVLVVYKAEVVGGTLQAGYDAADAALFDPDGLPDLPFPHDAQSRLEGAALSPTGEQAGTARNSRRVLGPRSRLSTQGWSRKGSSGCR